MGSSPLAYPALESRISNARRSCFALVFVFVRMDSMCSHARSVVTAWGREVFPAVDTSSRFHQRASSLSGRSHFWSLNLYSSPSHHRSVGFNKLGRKGAAPGRLQGCSRGAVVARALPRQWTGFPCQRAPRACCHILTGGWNVPARECDQIHCSWIRTCPLKHRTSCTERFRPAALPVCLAGGCQLHRLE